MLTHDDSDDACLRLLERDSLLDCLADNHAIGREQGRAVFVGGEAGAGKSALVRAFADRIGRRANVTVGHCDPLDTPRPLAGIADLAWALGGELGAAFDAAAPVHLVARGLLDAMEHAGPIVIEDLQWADAATLDVVRLACRRLDQAKGLLVVTYLDDQIGRRDPLRVLLGEVGTMGSVTRLHVEPLTVDAVESLSAGTGIDPIELHRRTLGNAFFVTEIVAAGGDSIPVTVSDAVLARAARLSAPARELLDAVAVVPQTCDWSLLDVLVPEPAGRVEECCAAGLLVETDATGGGVQFRHELARRALESALPAILRRQAHAVVLAHLTSAGGSDAARLAHHAEGAGDDAAVFAHASAAGMAAAAKGAHTEALKHLRVALSRAPGQLSPPDEARLAGTLAVEAYLSDLSAEAVAAQTRAVAALARAGDDRAEGGAWATLARMQWLDADLDGAFASVQRALDLLEPIGSGRELAMACSQRSALAMLTSDNPGAVGWGERAITLADACGAIDVMAHALNNVGTSEWFVGRDRGRELLLRSLELALQVDSVEDVGRAYANLSEQALLRMQPVDAHRFIDDGLTYSRSRGLTRSRVCLEARKADVDVVEARYDEAAAILDFLFALPSISAVTRIDALIGVGLLRARRGDPGVWDAIDEANVLAERFGEVDRLDNARRAEVEAAFLEGDQQRARDVAAATVVTAVAVDDHGADELVWWANRVGVDAAQPAFARRPFRLAAAGDHLGAAECFAAMEWRYHAALALHDAGDSGSLRRALDILHEIGARPLAKIVTRRLQVNGARSIARGPRPITRANEAGLTARELEILRLVNGNRSNREIAADLVVSVRTVEHHVSAMLAKLGASNRSDAVARAGELGLLRSG
jgi:DNA-binding CsgD family transcriptional regulator/tetratricopeptide (TPR) repeat protein